MKHKVQDKLAPAVDPLALSSEDAARALGVSPKTLANWRCAGRGACLCPYQRLPSFARSISDGGLGGLAALPPSLRGGG